MRSFFVPLHVTTRIKEDTYECSTGISAQCGGQSAFLRAYRDLVCGSPPVEASTCGGADSADFAEYVSDGGAGVFVPTGDGGSTPAGLCRPCCVWRSPHDRLSLAFYLRATAPARMGAPACLAVQSGGHH